MLLLPVRSPKLLSLPNLLLLQEVLRHPIRKTVHCKSPPLMALLIFPPMVAHPRVITMPALTPFQWSHSPKSMVKASHRAIPQFAQGAQSFSATLVLHLVKRL